MAPRQPKTAPGRAQAEEIRAYMGLAEKMPETRPITITFEEAKWDRLRPMCRTFLRGFGGRRGPTLVIWVWGVRGPCMLEVPQPRVTLDGLKAKGSQNVSQWVKHVSDYNGFC